MFSTQALERSPSSEEIQAARQHRKATVSNQHALLRNGVAVAFVILWVVVGANLIGDMGSFFKEEDNPFGPLVWIPVLLIGATFAVGVVGVVKGFFTRRRREARMLVFARENGLDYRPEFPGVPHDLYATVLQQGDKQQVLDLVRTRGQLSAVGTLRWTEEGSGDNKDRHYEFGFITWHLPRRLPQIVIDYRDRQASTTGNTTHGSARSQLLSFGQPFDSRFRVFTPAGTQQMAFQLFPPHVLEKLMQLPEGWDVEILGDQLTVFAPKPFPLESPDFWRAVAGTEQGVVADLSRISARMVDSRQREQFDVAAFGSQVLQRSPLGGRGVVATVFSVLMSVVVLAVIVLTWFLVGR